MSRNHHHQFAHVAMRQICALNPIRFFEIVAAGQERAIIAPIWSSVCESCDAAHSTTHSVEDFTVHRVRVADHPTVLVKLPELQELSGPIYVAVVLLSDPKSELAPEQIQYRYFTLERRGAAEQLSTELWEWNRQGEVSRSNGPNPTVRGFLAALGGKIQR